MKIFKSDDDLGLALNDMVDSDGIMNQQGSILHMEMDHHNGNSKKNLMSTVSQWTQNFHPVLGEKQARGEAFT